MRIRSPYFGIGLLLLLASSADAHRRHACCVKYITDESSCSSVCSTSECPKGYCRCAEEEIIGDGGSSGFIESLHPGVLLAQVRSRLLVEAVLPGSPAEASGIRPGDEIALINGERPFDRDTLGSSWEFQKTGMSLVEVVRGGKKIAFTIHLVPVKSLLEVGWFLRESHGTAARVRDVRRQQPDEAYGTHHFGMRLARAGESWVVTAVLAGSPADIAGVEAGQELIAVNRVGASDELIDKILNASVNSSVQVTLRDRNGSRSVHLVSMRITQILRNLGRIHAHIQNGMHTAGI
jgi:membrane-associated protease RseP (regulator of RpoE activity)